MEKSIAIDGTATNPGQEPVKSTEGVATGSAGTSTHHDQKRMESERIQFTNFSDDQQILKFVNEKSLPDHNTNLAVADLLKTTEAIIHQATHDSIGDNIQQPAIAQNVKIFTGDDYFISPLSILESICCEMSSCKGSSEEISIHTRTELIFDKLKPYSWEAKAVLALAAFALEYGVFCHLAQFYGQCDQLTKSVAILKRVPVLIKHTTEKLKEEVRELNHLIKATLQVTDFICKVEELLIHNNTKDVPTLNTAAESIPIHVFWIITTIVACRVKVTHLTSDEEKPYHLSYLVTNIKRILEILEKQHGKCLKEIDEVENYHKLRRKIKTCETTDKISDVIKTLILFKDGGKLPVISVGTSVNEVKAKQFVDVVNDNYVLFYISSLKNIAKEDISCLTKIHKEIENNKEKWTIVWIPIVEEWTENQNQIEKFEQWRSTMPWYKVQFFSSAVIRYIKEEWSYKGTAMAVVMNPQGKLENNNALPLIRKQGINFLQMDVTSVITHVIEHMHDPNLEKWSKDETKFIFFYGGTDVESQFNELEKKVKKANDTFKEFGVSIELFRVEGNKAKAGEEPNYSETHKSFWSGIESLFFSLINHYKQQEYTAVDKEVRYQLSNKEKDGWVMVSQGHTLIASGLPSTIYKVLKNIDQLKQNTKVTSFGIRFREYHDTVRLLRPDCCKFEIHGNAHKLVDCPDCSLPMEITSVQYNCCHPEFPKN